MSLEIIFRSHFVEAKNENKLAEIFVIELFDKTLPCPFLGGYYGLRYVLGESVTKDGAVYEDDWIYEINHCGEFGTTPKHFQKTRAENHTDALMIIARSLGFTETYGKLFGCMVDYFVHLKAPFAVNGVRFKASDAAVVKDLSAALDRKFGSELGDALRSTLNKRVIELERPPIFIATQKLAASYEAWADFA